MKYKYIMDWKKSKLYLWTNINIDWININIEYNK